MLYAQSEAEILVAYACIRVCSFCLNMLEHILLALTLCLMLKKVAYAKIHAETMDLTLPIRVTTHLTRFWRTRSKPGGGGGGGCCGFV